jgi:hypothetical protein
MNKIAQQRLKETSGSSDEQGPFGAEGMFNAAKPAEAPEAANESAEMADACVEVATRLAGLVNRHVDYNNPSLVLDLKYVHRILVDTFDKYDLEQFD